MEQFLEMAEWQQCTAVLYECAVAADSRCKESRSMEGLISLINNIICHGQ